MGPDVVTILATTLVYFFLILAFKIFGKKELSQLTVIDLVFILLISNAVQNAMVNGDWHSFVMGILAATTLFVLNYILKRLQYQFPWFRKLMGGSATILIEDGVKLADNLKSEEITDDELMAVIREHGVGKISEVKQAVLETDGNISVVSFDRDKTTIVSRRKRKVPVRLERHE